MCIFVFFRSFIVFSESDWVSMTSWQWSSFSFLKKGVNVVSVEVFIRILHLSLPAKVFKLKCPTSVPSVVKRFTPLKRLNVWIKFGIKPVSSALNVGWPSIWRITKASIKCHIVMRKCTTFWQKLHFSENNDFCDFSVMCQKQRLPLWLIPQKWKD